MTMQSKALNVPHTIMLLYATVTTFASPSRDGQQLLVILQFRLLYEGLCRFARRPWLTYGYSKSEIVKFYNFNDDLGSCWLVDV